MSTGRRKRVQAERMWAEMFSFVTGSELPGFQIAAGLGTGEINVVGLTVAVSLALTSEITGWQRFQHLEALEVEFLAMEGILVLAK